MYVYARYALKNSWNFYKHTYVCTYNFIFEDISNVQAIIDTYL